MRTHGVNLPVSYQAAIDRRFRPVTARPRPGQEGCGIGGYLERGMERIDDRTVAKRSPNLIDVFR